MNRALLALFLIAPASGADVSIRTLNDGNLILEDVPELPAALAAELNRYQHERSGIFQDWTADESGIFITTRFADVEQLHRVDLPGGARHQLTFLDEPIGGVLRQPGGSLLAFTMDVGGSEFDQIYLLDPATGQSRLMTDGESKNAALAWSRDGRTIAFQSTRRNGRSNDLWALPVATAAPARMILEAPAGFWWGPVDFSPDGRQLLVENYVSVTDSRLYLLDLVDGERRRLAGSESKPSTNVGFEFDSAGRGFYYATDRHGEFTQLAHRTLAPEATEQIISADIAWDVTGFDLSADGTRAAFVVNEEGFSRLYLLDPGSHRYRAVEVPIGVIFHIAFNPDGSRLALTLSSARTPSDVYVLALGPGPLEHGALERWTFSEVGGLDTDRFAVPELVRYPTFDQLDGRPRTIPAFLYRPPGAGPHPVIVSIHGGPESQFRPRFSSTYQSWIDQLGAAVIAPNVRGSSGYGREYVGLDNGYRREDSVRDIGALLDWIATRDDLDASRVAVIGGSYGGYMVLASAVHYSARLRAAVDVVGISSFVTFLENTEDYRRDLRRMEYGDERDPAMRAHLEAISPLNRADRIKVPLLVVQGQNDPRVPVSESRQLVDAVRRQGHEVWYLNALNEGHGYARKANRDVYRQAVVMFFRRYL